MCIQWPLFSPEITGIKSLDDDIISGRTKFDNNTIEITNLFLSQLLFQICLQAHNGDQYDFPLIKAGMKIAGKQL